MKPHNKRAEHIAPFHVMRILARAKALEEAGRDIVHMEIGEPDFPTAEPILAAAQRCLQRGAIHYTAATGLPELKRCIAAHYRRQYGVSIASERIIVTPGASSALLLALAAVLDQGEEVLLTDPGYPCNRNMATFLGAHARTVAVGPESAYHFTPTLIEQHWREHTRAVLLASPSNPTGTLIDASILGAIARTVQERDGVMLVDEIYHGLVYTDAPQSVLNVTDRAFVINSFSKYFGMTGWRLGWLIAPPDYQDTLDRFAQNIYLAAATVSQYAAIAAFEPETLTILEQRRKQFQQRRDFLLPQLQQLGFEVAVEPQGAFYIYAACRRFSDDSLEFCEDVLEQAGVAITPGIDFGEFNARQHVRFSYTTTLEKLKQGVARLRGYLHER